MSDNTTFINTAYVDEQSERDFMNGIANAYRKYLVNRAAEAHKTDGEELKGFEEQVVKQTTIQTLCTLVSNIIMDISGGNAKHFEFILKSLIARTAAMKLNENKVVYAVDAAIDHIARNREMPDPAKIAQEMLDRGIITPEQAEKAVNLSELMDKFGAPIEMNEAVNLRITGENAKEFLQTVTAAMKQNEEFVFWEGHKVPTMAASMIAKEVLNAIDEAEGECDCPNCRAEREAEETVH